MKDEIDFEPVFDFLLIEPIKPGTTAGGLALPEGVETGPMKGVVVRAGPGRINELGTLTPMPVAEGDVVYCCFTLGGQPPELTFGKRHLLVVPARHLIGKVNQRGAVVQAEAEVERRKPVKIAA